LRHTKKEDDEDKLFKLIKEQVLSIQGWTFKDNVDGPFQENGKDCGVFVAARVYYSMHGASLTSFPSDAVEQFRDFMVAKLKYVRGEETSDCSWDISTQRVIFKKQKLDIVE
jgi:hypothetical protein